MQSHSTMEQLCSWGQDNCFFPVDKENETEEEEEVKEEKREESQLQCNLHLM